MTEFKIICISPSAMTDDNALTNLNKVFNHSPTELSQFKLFKPFYG